MFRKITFILVAMGLLAGCQGLMTREGIKEQDQKREIVERVSTLQKTSADVNNRFSEVDGDIRDLSGKIEVLENKVNQTRTTSEKERKENEEQIADLKKKIGLLQEELMKVQEQVTALASDKLERASEKTEKADKSGFDTANELFDNKEWKKAILSFQKFREVHPKDKRVPEASYKIGVSFQELGMKDEAKTFFEELISKYPKSNEAKKAKIRMKKLKTKE